MFAHVNARSTVVPGENPHGQRIDRATLHHPSSPHLHLHPPSFRHLERAGERVLRVAFLSEVVGIDLVRRAVRLDVGQVVDLRLSEKSLSLQTGREFQERVKAPRRAEIPASELSRPLALLLRFPFYHHQSSGLSRYL